jgi:hypothetical protein
MLYPSSARGPAAGVTLTQLQPIVKVTCSNKLSGQEDLAMKHARKGVGMRVGAK